MRKKDVNQEIQKILFLKTKAQKISTLAHNRMECLRGRIRSGEATTGDRIKDFVIARYGIISEGFEKVYRNLEARVKQHVGQFVLMVTKEEKFCGCVGFGHKPQNRDYIIEEHLYFGVLQGGGLVLDFPVGKCGFPTGNYVECESSARHETYFIEGNLMECLSKDICLALDKILVRRDIITASFQNRPELELEIKIGNREVEAWFTKEKEGGRPYIADTFHKMAQLLHLNYK